jgi:predicted Fe-Mo cluster-binding NifX family protein
MKIAVASEGTKVSQHFGHCANFNVFEIENDKIISSVSIKNGDHEHGCVPDFLNTSGVTLIITGGIGGGAVTKLKNMGLDVIMGASGDAKAAAEAFISGTLKSSEVLCSEHQHGDAHDGHSCGGHHGDGHSCHHSN